MPITEKPLLLALQSVLHPDLYKDILTLNLVREILPNDGDVVVRLELPPPAPAPLRDKLKADITAALLNVPGVASATVNISVPMQVSQPAAKGHAHAAPPGPSSIPGVKHIIAVGAGKGGVGKSTLAVNIAVGLALTGAKVGLLDGDIYGPSIPTMTGLQQQPPVVRGEMIIPFTVGPANSPIRVMSIGFLVDREKALIWRGPMAHGAVKQFLEQVEWGELDYLIVDLPPGTGDVSLTLAQVVSVTGAVIVATPQEVALADARRAVRMFQQLGVEILGVVENMSYFVCDHGTEYDIFGRGGAQLMAQTMGLPFLGSVPIDMRLRQNSDTGTPWDNFAATASTGPLKEVVDTLLGQLAIRLTTRPEARSIKLEIS